MNNKLESLLAVALVMTVALAFLVTLSAPRIPELGVSRSAAFWYEASHYQRPVQVTDIRTNETHTFPVLLGGTVQIMG